jgi:glycerophosphoryl diester phosphodiesterase
LDFSRYFGPEYAGERIPTLEEVVDAFGAAGLLNIEIANYMSPLDGLAAAVCRVVRRFGQKPRILLTSFLPRNLMLCRRLMPETARGLLALHWQVLGAQLRFMLGGIRHCSLTSQASVQAGTARPSTGTADSSWTVNRQADLLGLRGMGVDGIITDDVAGQFEPSRGCMIPRWT